LATVVLAAALLGVVLGLTMRVGALLLVLALVAATTVVSCVAHGAGLWAVLAPIGTIISLQSGYLLGASAHAQDAHA
jgi:hypothetical protein